MPVVYGLGAGLGAGFASLVGGGLAPLGSILVVGQGFFYVLVRLDLKAFFKNYSARQAVPFQSPLECFGHFYSPLLPKLLHLQQRFCF